MNVYEPSFLAGMPFVVAIACRCRANGFSALQQVFNTASQWITGLEDLARAAIPVLAAMLADNFDKR